MNVKVIEPFTDLEVSLSFQGGVLFQSGNRCLLHGAHGHIILMDNILSEQLSGGHIPPEISTQLVSRGFCGSMYSCNFDISQRIRPEFFMVDLTDRCNLKCKYCFRNIKKQGCIVSDSVLTAICQYIEDYCNQVKLKDVSIQPWGGEPLLAIDAILKMHELIHPTCTKVHFSIETNGTLLTPEILDLLFSHQIGLGISIDGTQNCHDAQRVYSSGAPTYQTVACNLRLATQKYGSRLGTITTITRLNYTKIEEILEHFALELNLLNVKFNFVHNSKFADCKGLCLAPSEIADTELRLLRKMVELNNRGYPIREANIVTKLKNLLFNEYSDVCLSKGCGGGKKMIAFDVKGNIYPCELTDSPEEAMGNIFYSKQSLIELIQSKIGKEKYFQKKQVEKCISCPWHCYCKGGCTVRMINAGVSPPEIDTTECAINNVLYPELVDMILTHEETVNRILGYRGVDFNGSNCKQFY